MHGRDVRGGGERVKRKRNPQVVRDFVPSDIVELEGGEIAMVTAHRVAGVSWVRSELGGGRYGEFRPVQPGARAKGG